MSFSAGGAGKPPGIQTGGSLVKIIEGTGTSRRKQEVVTEDADVLMERVRAHDADAFEALYDAHHRLVYGVALRMLGDAPGAEDVTQAVFVKVWTSPELFRGGNFGAWIVRITRNRALDALRNRATRNEGELPEALPETEGIEDVAFARIDAQLVRTALAESGRAARADRAGFLMESRTRKSRGAAAFRWARLSAYSLGITQAAFGPRRGGDGMSDQQPYHDMLDDVALYALGTLPAADAQRVRDQIASCAAYRAEDAALAPAAALVGVSAETQGDLKDCPTPCSSRASCARSASRQRRRVTFAHPRAFQYGRPTWSRRRASQSRSSPRFTTLRCRVSCATLKTSSPRARHARRSSQAIWPTSVRRSPRS